MSARHPSRRLFVCGLGALFAVAPRSIAAGGPIHEADRAFITWMGAIAFYNRQEADPPAGEPDPLWQAVEAAESTFAALPASPMALAGSELIEVSYEAHTDETLTDVRRPARDSRTHACIRSLECVSPYLSGLIGRAADDLLKHPHRPIGESLLWRLRCAGSLANAGRQA